MNQQTGLTSIGKIVSGLLVVALIAIGVVVFKKKSDSSKPAEKARQEEKANQGKEKGEAPEGLTETQTGPPDLEPAAPYVMKDNILDVDISEYPGYAGLIVANNGLEPTENSTFFKNHGFKVRIKLSEEESWSALNSGKMGVSVTTTDVLAVLGKQFQVSCPLLISYSRGADGIVVQKDIKRLNALQGKTLVTIQFTEADFFIRYLAQEAGIGVNMLADLDAEPVADKINLVFCEDGEECGNVLLEELKGRNRLAGTITWAPTTDETVENSGGKARMLTTNRNLLIISDIAVVNKTFGQQNPKIVAGLVEGWLEGNKALRNDAPAHYTVIGKAFKWEAAKTKAELEKVHFANLPENIAYFSGAIDAAGSFGGIYQSAVQAYGSMIPDSPPSDRFVDSAHLMALQAGGKFADEKISLAPIKSATGSALENDPLLTKDIRFFFDPNSSNLVRDSSSKEGKTNASALDDVAKLVRVSPGSTILMVGHVDDALVEQFKAQGNKFYADMRLKAVQLSKDRADGVKKVIVTDFKVDPTRVTTDGKGWDKPASKTDRDANRRVEVQWFTLE